MQFTVLALIAGAAAIAQAAPPAYGTGSTGSSGSPGSSSSESVGFGTCAPHTKIACCQQASGRTGILGNVLGGACGLSDITGGVCRGGDTFCCPTKQTGELDISLSCFPLTLKLR